MRVETKISEFAGKPIIAIYEIKENGTLSERALIQFGYKKAQAILSSIDAIRKFLDDKEKQND